MELIVHSLKRFCICILIFGIVWHLRRINDVEMEKIQYQECESKRVGALKADECEVKKEIRKSKGKRKLVS